MRYRLFYPQNQQMVSYIRKQEADLAGILENYVFAKVWDDRLEGDDTITDEDWLNVIWARHNYDLRPDGRINRSMCVGDIVILDGLGAWVALFAGWRKLTMMELFNIQALAPLGSQTFQP